MKKIIFATAFAVLMMLTSCATIVSGSKQLVKFTSNPSVATVFINDVEVGKTPFETKLKRNKKHHVMIKLDGYKTYETKLTRKFNAWYLGNVLIGGGIGLIIDPITGAIFSLSPDEVNAQMANGVASTINKDEVFVAVSLEIDENWEKVGQLEKKWELESGIGKQ